jgi:uncharacterized protein (DUF2164 family)
MNEKNGKIPTRINLSDERKDEIIQTLKAFYMETFDEELSSYRAEQILRFFVKTLGPPVYNQAIQDARGFMQEKLDDLDAIFYEKEEPEQTGDDHSGKTGKDV